MPKKPKIRVILTEDQFKFDWKNDQVEKVKKYIEQGLKLQEIAEKTNENEYNIFLLLIDLDSKGEI